MKAESQSFQSEDTEHAAKELGGPIWQVSNTNCFSVHSSLSSAAKTGETATAKPVSVSQ